MKDKNRTNPNPGAAKGRSFEPQKQRCATILTKLTERIGHLLRRTYAAAAAAAAVAEAADMARAACAAANTTTATNATDTAPPLNCTGAANTTTSTPASPAKLVPTNFTVALLRGHPMMHDLVRLAYAPVTICSASTFCLWPALAKNALIERVLNAEVASPHLRHLADNANATTQVAAFVPVTKIFAGSLNVDYNLSSHFVWIQSPPLVRYEPYAPATFNFQTVLDKLEHDGTLQLSTIMTSVPSS